MTPTDFREALRSLGIKQLEAARELGVSEVTVSRWATGWTDIRRTKPQPVPRYAEAWLREKSRNVLKEG